MFLLCLGVSKTTAAHHIHQLRDSQSKFYLHCSVQILHWSHPFLIVPEEFFKKFVLCFGIGRQHGRPLNKTRRISQRGSDIRHQSDCKNTSCKNLCELWPRNVFASLLRMRLTHQMFNQTKPNQKCVTKTLKCPYEMLLTKG